MLSARIAGGPSREVECIQKFYKVNGVTWVSKPVGNVAVHDLPEQQAASRVLSQKSVPMPIFVIIHGGGAIADVTDTARLSLPRPVGFEIPLQLQPSQQIPILSHGPDALQFQSPVAGADAVFIVIMSELLLPVVK
jgi:hypothetical protein